MIVEGSPVSLAAIAWGHAAGALVRPVGGVVIGADGTLAELADVPVERLSPTRWQIGEGSPIEIDEAGLPVLADGEWWPLELG